MGEGVHGHRSTKLLYSLCLEVLEEGKKLVESAHLLHMSHESVGAGPSITPTTPVLDGDWLLWVWRRVLLTGPETILLGTRRRCESRYPFARRGGGRGGPPHPRRPT